MVETNRLLIKNQWKKTLISKQRNWFESYLIILNSLNSEHDIDPSQISICIWDYGQRSLSERLPWATLSKCTKRTSKQYGVRMMHGTRVRSRSASANTEIYAKYRQSGYNQPEYKQNYLQTGHNRQSDTVHHIMMTFKRFHCNELHWSCGLVSSSRPCLHLLDDKRNKLHSAAMWK